ncbi:MAG: hypothetical protein ABI702_19690 [Burkholderiales bacterium]
MQHDIPSNHPVMPGILDKYVVDSTECFGLFIQLNSYRAFVDIRDDKFIEQRKARALQLYENQELLSKNLRAFLESNAEFRSRRVEYIGLHSKDLEQGEVFWEPNGYKLLKGFEFQPN